MNPRQDEKTRDTLRSRRKRPVRARTIDIRRLTKCERQAGQLLYPESDDVHEQRPKTRAECIGGYRPCPFCSCRYHLAIDVLPNGSIKLNFPDLEIWEMQDTCALDIADRGGRTLEEIGDLLNITRERTRQIEARAFRSLPDPVRAQIRELVGEGVPDRGSEDTEDDDDDGWAWGDPDPDDIQVSPRGIADLARMTLL